MDDRSLTKTGGWDGGLTDGWDGGSTDGWDDDWDGGWDGGLTDDWDDDWDGGWDGGWFFFLISSRRFIISNFLLYDLYDIIRYSLRLKANW